MKPKTVLLVDDEQEFAEALAERMETRGLTVRIASTGEDALTLAREQTFDAIVLDLAMPGMDGIETFRRLREHNPDVQVILLTGHATLDKGLEAMKLGAVDFLEKPAELSTLMKKIDQASAQKRDLMQQRMDEQLSDILRRKGW